MTALHFHIGCIVVHGAENPSAASLREAVARGLAASHDAAAIAVALGAGGDALSAYLRERIGSVVRDALQGTTARGQT